MVGKGANIMGYPADLFSQLQQARLNNFQKPYLVSRVARVGASIRDNYALVPDFNGYGPNLDWTKFSTYISAAILRGSYGAIGFGGAVDTSLAKNCTDAAANNKPAIIYHAVDPGYYMDRLQDLTKMANLDQYLPPEKDAQWQTFMQAIQYKKYYGL